MGSGHGCLLCTTPHVCSSLVGGLCISADAHSSRPSKQGSPVPCAAARSAAQEKWSPRPSAWPGEIDYVYVPVDFRMRATPGFAFSQLWALGRCTGTHGSPRVLK